MWATRPDQAARLLSVMLPDFPALKNVLMKRVHRKVDAFQKAQHPVLEKIRTFTQHEGTAANLQRVGYGRKLLEPQMHTFQFSIKKNEIADLTGDALDARLMELANEMGGAKVRMLIARVTEATQMTGNMVDAKGQPANGNLLLDVMDSVDESLDAEGNSQLSWLVHPDSLPGLQRASQEVENDPELSARRDSIIARKRQQWLDRENRRKLVD